MLRLLLAYSKKSATVRPSIYGTAATLISSLLMYYISYIYYSSLSYLFLSGNDLSEEVDVGRLYLGQVGMSIMCQEGVELLLAATFLCELEDINSGILVLVSVHRY